MCETTATNLILVRHGQTEFNKQNRLQGLSNSSLTTAGIQAAQSVGKSLQDIPIFRTYCSDSIRTIQTATEILTAANKADVPLIKESFLREYYFGDFEGVKYNKAFRQLVQRYGLRTSRQVLNGTHFLEMTLNGFSHLDQTGQAENYQEISNRLQAGLKRILEQPENQGQNLLVVSHGVLLGTLIYMVDPEKTPRTLLKNASVSLLRYSEGRFKIIALNQTNIAEIKELL
ncbi:histidine phosphatase family protein [Agrilactobacillus yilanensis]|uniref:Histidine phosphatase family protein n=1 Tax=Agrilactobacillus yilanensis TaxID=2485997 RepID=A0ABW4J5H3_9LACO|nr:histidine phosphatase family protein [Agrilactobacillus yilanensis]